MGRREARSPWEAFCQRLGQSVKGTFLDQGLSNGAGTARLIAAQPADVRHARSLCAEYGVIMALDGVQLAAAHDGFSVLWVQAGRDLSSVRRMADGGSQWFVQPGCLLGELEAAGLRYFADLPSYLSIAAWLADRTLCNWPAGATQGSGLILASVLLADGSDARLGPFGVNNQAPLGSLTLQRLVPSLFQLVAGPEAQACGRQALWPVRYRLDALTPSDPGAVNLAQLMLGHGGDLGWVDWIVLDDAVMQESPTLMSPVLREPIDGMDPVIACHADEIEMRIKQLFDPHGLFPHPGQSL